MYMIYMLFLLCVIMVRLLAGYDSRYLRGTVYLLCTLFSYFGRALT